MPRRCCVPGCKSNYDTSLKNGEQAVSTFSFPKDESLRRRWTLAIPRADWSPTSGSFICSNHFSPKEVIRMDQIHRSDGSIEDVPLRCPRLVPDSVPHIFPNLPKYLSTEATTSRRDPQVRRQNNVQKHEDKIEAFLKSDMIESFSDLKEGLQTKIDLCPKWKLKVASNNIYFYTVNIDFLDALSPAKDDEICDGVKVLNSIVITADLVVKVFLGNNALSEHDLKWILPFDLKLSRWSELENLLIRYNTCAYSSEPSSTRFDYFVRKSHEYIVKAINHVDENSSPLDKQLDIIRDQLKLFIANKRQYSVSTKIFAFLIYFQSPSCYELLRRFLFLPHKRYLQYLSASLNVSPDQESNDYHYLIHMYKNLNEREKIVNLVIDEIYISSKVEYKAKKIDGYSKSNPNELAKTVQSFMISSPFGHFQEIVKLFPTNAMTSEQLEELTLRVIEFVQSIGFKIICIITDNNRVNQRMFKTILNNNLFLENPDKSGDQLFGMYDTVHIFKNIRNNWLNLKSPGKTFMFPLFETGDIKMAAFEHVEKLYNEEKKQVIKKAYKLNSKTLFPTKFERQSVILVDNLFHNSTIAALISDKSSKSTGEFLKIIRNWWNIVNVKNKIKSIIKRDDQCCALKSTTDPNVIFLKQFILWLYKWKDLQGGSFLSTDTFNALVHSTSVLINIIEVSLNKYKIEYILLGKFQSDCLEKRFGQYRRLSGCNYHVSCTQIIESEKKIRVKQIMRMENLNDIKNVAKCDAVSETSDAEEFQFILSTDYLETCDIEEESQSYVCGYAVHSVLKKIACNYCSLLIRENKGGKVNKVYFDYLQRGGLSIPADTVKFLCFHLYAIFEYIINDVQLKGTLFQKNDVRNVLCDLTFSSLQSGNFYIDLDGSCELGHPTKHAYYLVCKVIVNIMLNNYSKNVNDSLNEVKNNKRKLGVYVRSR